MRKRIGVLWMMLVLVAALAACGQGDGAGDSAANPTGNENNQEAAKALDKGEIVKKDNDRLLITAYVDNNGEPYIDAYWFNVSDKTELQTGDGRTVTPAELNVGAQVEVWHTGTVQESYPAQATAAKIVVHSDGGASGAPEGSIVREKAVRTALQAQDASIATAAWAVKSASLQAEDGYWQVELVKHESVQEPVVVRVDAQSGEVAPVPVAENEAFRVYAPAPGTKAGPVFTVEGEARVFEAAFSWELEDGHNILAQGHAMAEGGAPAWAPFRFDVSFEKASQPNMMLILYEASAKDGSPAHQLVVPLKVPDELIQYKP